MMTPCFAAQVLVRGYESETRYRESKQEQAQSKGQRRPYLKHVLNTTTTSFSSTRTLSPPLSPDSYLSPHPSMNDSVELAARFFR